MRRSSTFSLDQVRADQLGRLNRGLELLRRVNPFWRDRLHPVRSWADFERLPLTTRADLEADQTSHPPFGTNLTFPLDGYTRFHQTAGARPLGWLDTAETWEWCTRIWSEQVLPAAGVTAQDRIFFGSPPGASLGLAAAFGGAERLGALVIDGSMLSPRALLDTAATVVVCRPGDEVPLDLARSAARSVVGVGGSGAAQPGAARWFETAYQTELGPTAFGCPLGDGVHLIESEYVFELVDRELVATNLGRWSMPLVRYRTGDRAELSYGCACGCPFAKAVGGLHRL